MTRFKVFGCAKCGQSLTPGRIPCKTKSLDMRPDGTVILVLEATCSWCGGPIEVEWFLYCYGEEVE